MILLPRWSPFDTTPQNQRQNELWLVASREKSPGLVASYQIDFPYWGFIEHQAAADDNLRPDSREHIQD
jgi:hypothetical protein